MKIEIKFSDLDESSASDIINYSSYMVAYDAVWTRLFRPRHKHGYEDPVINDLIEKNPACEILMDKLEQIYRDYVEINF